MALGGDELVNHQAINSYGTEQVIPGYPSQSTGLTKKSCYFHEMPLNTLWYGYNPIGPIITSLSCLWPDQLNCRPHHRSTIVSATLAYPLSCHFMMAGAHCPSPTGNLFMVTVPHSAGMWTWESHRLTTLAYCEHMFSKNFMKLCWSRQLDEIIFIVYLDEIVCIKYSDETETPWQLFLDYRPSEQSIHWSEEFTAQRNLCMEPLDFFPQINYTKLCCHIMMTF